jgi:hypothetical protein
LVLLTQKSFFTTAAIIAALFGFGFILMPAAVLAEFGASTDKIGFLLGSHFGIALAGFGLILFMARDIAKSRTQNGILWAGLLTSTAYALFALIATLDGTINAFGWLLVTLNAALALGFALIAIRAA